MKSLYFIFLFAMIMFYSCSKKSDDAVNPPNTSEEPPINFADTASLEAITRNLNNYIPTWKELERFTNTAERLPVDFFKIRALAGTGDFGTSITIDKSMHYFDNINSTFINDISCALFTHMPPYTDEKNPTSEVEYPLSGEFLDKRLRATTAFFLREKALGRPTLFVNFYPPHLESPHFVSESDFLKFLDEKFIPEKIAEAKAAELMKAEYYIAWPLEFELFIKDLGGLNDGGFLSGYSNEQILAFAHTVKNKIRDEVKKYYYGKLVAHSYWNFSSMDSLWDRFDYKGFDEIHFAFFPQGDLTTTGLYLDKQLKHYSKVIQNSGNIPWAASEVSVFKRYFASTDFSKIEKDIYELVFNKLENAPIPPSGISVGVDLIETTEARDYVQSYFRSR